MHLTFERNIKVPGSFVVLQGIPGDGLANTIDVAPEFHFPQQLHLQQQQERLRPQEFSANTSSRNSAPPNIPTSTGRNDSMASNRTPTQASSFQQHRTFLGQGITPLLFPSLFSLPTLVPSSAGRIPSATHVPFSSESNSSFSEGMDENGGQEESFVLVNEDNPSIPDGTYGSTVGVGTTPVDPAVQRSIDLWQEERVRSHHRAAMEWLESAVLQQRQTSKQANSDNTIPILSKIVHSLKRDGQSLPTYNAPSLSQHKRWWLCEQNAQLQVFPTLPCPRPSTENDDSKNESIEENSKTPSTLPPGTTVVGIALHTFDLDPHFWRRPSGKKKESINSESADSDVWKYIGQCTYFNGQEHIPPEHCPQPGRIQYLYIESPLQGYILFSVDGYAVLSPGLPSSSLFTGLETDDDETYEYEDNSILRTCWWWKVTYYDGAIVRQGLDLNTKQLCNLPYGTHVQVLRKMVNTVGLSRLLVVAHVRGQSPVEGWCSEFLNPMAGQRGSILQPVPLAVPVWYQIRKPCTVRKEVELSSAVVRKLEIIGAMTPVLARKFTEFPAVNCLERLQLAPLAYASLRLNSPPVGSITRNGCIAAAQELILVPTGDIDGTFDPSAPGLYHWQNYLKWMRPQHGSHSAPEIFNALQSESSTGAAPPQTQDASHGATQPNPGTVVVANESPSSSVAAEVGSVEESLSSTSIHSKTQQSDHNRPRLCMCCEDKIANATLIHGQTGHICCCLECARIIQAQKLGCPICRLEIDNVILHFYS